MTFKELNIFYRLCESPHTSKLAKELNISQSAISLSIKSLESKLNEPLFDRIGKKLVLNERGRIFKTNTYKHYIALIEYQKIFQTNKVSGELNIGVSKTINNYILPQIMYEFIKKNPEVKINKTTANSLDIVNKVIKGEVDIGFTESNLNYLEINNIELSTDELIIVSSDKELQKKSFYIDNLYDKDWILREKGSGTREVFLDTLGDLSKDLNIILESSQFEEIKTLVKNNPQTITCISNAVVKEELKNGELFKIDVINFEFKRKFNFVYHKDKSKSLLFKAFENFSKDYFKNLI